MLLTETVSNTGNPLIDALTWGSKWDTVNGTQVVTVGVKVEFGPPPTRAELKAIAATLKEYERVIDVKFNFIGVDYAGQADLSFSVYNDPWESKLGWAVPAGEERSAPYGDANIIRDNYVAGPAIKKGGADFITFVHEFGHVMGLAHPFDGGGSSSLFPGVFGASSLGQYGLNQGVFTTMSGNDGWASSGLSQTQSYGLQTGLMALDIQALQYMYGANLTTNAGDDIYCLAKNNAKSVGYTCIWDTGGIDTIVSKSKVGCVIDLRSATGLVGEGAGGFISHVNGVRGGFTIAVGAAIENATGNKGADSLTGNAAANVLDGRNGDDSLTGLGGQDVLIGGAGADRFVFVTGTDSGPTQLSADIIVDFSGGDRIDLAAIDADAGLLGNQVFDLLDFASSFSAAGQVRIGYSGGNTVLYLNTDADMSTESVIVLSGIHTLTADDFLL
jgi:serralysin